MQFVHKELRTKAMATENDGLMVDQTFETVTVPKDRKVVKLK